MSKPQEGSPLILVPPLESPTSSGMHHATTKETHQKEEKQV